MLFILIIVILAKNLDKNNGDFTGFINDWKHFFDLRCATNAHPQAQELAIPLREEFVKKGYITDNK